MADLDQELDRLFGLPLDEFTSARNDLAKRLKAEGEAEAADEIQSVAKPAVAAWTVNQLVRKERKGIQALLRAGDELREAQKRLLAGEDAAGDMRNATASERDAVGALSKSARTLLGAAGRPASQAMLDRVGETLRAAAVTDDGRRLLESGRLTIELEAAGFGELTAPVEAGGRRRAQRPAKETSRRERERARQEHQALQRRVRDLERAARTAEREAERAEAAAEDARERARAARADAQAAAELVSARRSY